MATVRDDPACTRKAIAVTLLWIDGRDQEREDCAAASPTSSWACSRSASPAPTAVWNRRVPGQPRRRMIRCPCRPASSSSSTETESEGPMGAPEVRRDYP